MERREHERLPVRQAQNVDHSLPYRVMNVSKTGCFLETRQPLGEVESTVAFELPLPAGADSLTLAARIVWRDVDPERELSGWFRYGLSFNGTDRISELILDAYVEFLRRDLHVAQLEDAWHKREQRVDIHSLLLPVICQAFVGHRFEDRLESFFVAPERLTDF